MYILALLNSVCLQNVHAVRSRIDCTASLVKKKKMEKVLALTWLQILETVDLKIDRSQTLHITPNTDALYKKYYIKTYKKYYIKTYKIIWHK